MPKKVGIILVNYHDYAERFLSACRDSLRKQIYSKDLFRVYIIDNDSGEETLDYLKKNYPEAVVLPRLDGNYSAANNLGAKEAIKDGCEYIVSVNMDTEMDENWLLELVEALDNNPEAGIAQSKILLYPKNDLERAHQKINSVGNVLHFLGFGFTSGYNQPDYEIKGYPEIKGYASGCSFIIRAQILKKIGMWNEEFYMYHDDIELSLKNRLAGYKIILAPQSIIFHKYEFSRSIRMFYYMERNRLLLSAIFFPRKYRLALLPLSVVMSLGMGILMFLQGNFFSWLKIMFYVLSPRTRVKIYLYRHSLKGISVTPFSSIAKSFASRIAFQEVDNWILKYIVNPLMALYFRMIKKTF